ncbi:chromate efflux transporter [Reyranella sp.]|uniref:chromate efflux transporter n=1 Tax=Reyranella sp. TaxID=1929291 RepID=UPI00273111EF|nr:chromate efflux transporter [Reyranella sp.]MDP2375776.1 chromate efflux transporter [Reyranella sp.]
MTEIAENADEPTRAATPGGTPGTWIEVLAIFLRLGLTSFGGPVAHLGYFREEFVAKRKWIDDRTYADIVALCQFLPGPASSQVGIAIGLSRAGYAGAFAAWTGFTLPSAIALVAFAYGVDALGGLGGSGWLHGLKVAAVAVVAQAVLGMMRTLTPDRDRATVAVVTAGVILALPSAWTLVGMILVGGIVGILLLRGDAPTDHVSLPLPISRRAGGVFLVIFFVLLAGLPLLAAATSSHGIELFDAFYRAGSLVFGGGHVILPLLQEAVVPPGWVSNDLFLAGYGAAQAVPGPLTTFAAYLGAIMTPGPNGVAGAALCLVAAFVPSFLLVFGALPFWEELRRRSTAQAALRGVNAAVVGILLAALYDPVWTSGITSPADFALGAGAFLLLFTWKTPPWLVVVLCALGGALIGAL